MAQPSAAEALVTQAATQVVAASPDTLDLALDTAASMLAAADWPEVSRALIAQVERTVTRAWAIGWRPADLVRLVRRELGAVHQPLAVDLIAAENRSHPAATLDRRWHEQLRELAVEIWWSGDEAYLADFATRHRLDRFALATAVLELNRLWAQLPPVTPVGPTPGRATVYRPNGPMPGEPRMLSRIRALLAKAESTEFPEEAEALTAKAQQLVAQHSIDEALLTASQPSRDTPGALRIGVDNPYESPKAMLLDAVASANRCRTVWAKEFGFCTIIGFDSDLDAVELLYTSLLVQANASMHRAGSRHHKEGAARTKSFRQSFLIAYATRIRERLAAATEETTREAAAGRHLNPDGSSEQLTPDERLLPALAAREQAVDHAVGEMFPKLTTQRVRISNAHGWHEGRAAADRAALHHGTGAIER
ncbi:MULTISPECIES: DUF2786 domain-containing protein [unclassified Kitasatospora]|uniref:DUF2786 domain-containing protein n=1 Tax=unclassified Kitasatospora TaxID=2633591 RepID=UPI00070FDA4B|nr:MULTISPECIES: DUF2786 domain-containing protein [unclassified Kitasatospora]KQV18504.1 hypothetical protein ASC99_04540 [Kitasatospora sp. Root107]KRB74488.1 hypothetical protein ASE03_18460 [Kitasatospora sp. Root187]